MTTDVQICSKLKSPSYDDDMIIHLHVGTMFSGKTTSLSATYPDYLHITHTYATDDDPNIHKSDTLDLDDDEFVQMMLSGGVIIDEVQFFSPEILFQFINTCQMLGVDIHLSGLDYDYLRNEWPTITMLKAKYGDNLEEIHHDRLCARCKKYIAIYTARINTSEKKIILTDKSYYLPVCVKCYDEMMISNEIVYY